MKPELDLIKRKIREVNEQGKRKEIFEYLMKDSR